MSDPLWDIVERYRAGPAPQSSRGATPDEYLPPEPKPGELGGPAANGVGNRESAKASRFRFIGSTEFAGGDYRPSWLIKKVLVKGQPGLIAGPSKTLKTSLLVDLAVSLASGREFLGTFDIAHPARVAIVSGESGEHTLQETGRRICEAKGIALESLSDRLNWCFDLPTLADLDVMADFASELAKLKAEVVLIDPVYLALGNLDAKSMFEMGAALRVVAQVLLGVGCTPVLAHHANRKIEPGEPIELMHIAYSGLDQFARQFILLNRREKYRGDGAHDLWVRVGGSVGHGGLWSLHVEEGQLADDFTGREWRVNVQTLNEVNAAASDRREEERRELARKKMATEQAAVLLAIDAEMATQEAATKTRIKERTGYSTTKLNEVLTSLVEDGAVQEVEFDKTVGNGATRRTQGFKRACSGEH